MPRNNGLQYESTPTGPKRANPFTTSSEVDLGPERGSPIVISKDGMKIENSDGSVTINWGEPARDTVETAFHDNLAEKMSDEDLARLAGELLEGIEADIQTRKDWLDIRSKGLQMLALKIEEPRGDIGNTSAPFEGMSSIRHSLMLEATVAFQAGARGELLPAKGPVKVKNAGPGGNPMNAPDGNAALDELANALENNFNHYLTDVAREYVPDTDRMLFYTAFGGDGFKKLYHCPLRRRPVSESVDAEDLIVSNAATDLASCGRVTHRIKMRRSTLKRMQLVGEYRDVDLYEPQIKPADEVQQQKGEIGGYNTQPMRPKDADFELYESYVECDLPQFAPAKFKNSGVPLSYRVTIETGTRKILEVRRNWKADDEECTPRQVFVQFPFIRGIGFYGLGFVHLLGNTTMALTAAYRLMLDAGMYGNFPGFIYDKQVGRQLTNQFRAPPGGGIGVDLPVNKNIQQVIMPMPYKDVGPAMPAFIQHLEDRGKQVAMVANSAIGEGKQDAPVGTTLALIEQATKVEASAFKRLHDAQAEEFRLLKELFIEDPEAMWRHSKGRVTWQRQQFVTALNQYELVPVADPNNPSALHRAMKAAMVKMLAMQQPQLYDMIAVDRRVMSMANIDASGLFRPPQPPQMDPVQAALQARQQQLQMQGELRRQEQQLKAALQIAQQQGKVADRASKEKIEAMKMQLERTRQEEEMIVEQMKMNMAAMQHIHEHMRSDRDFGMQRAQGEREHGLKRDQFAHQQQQDQFGRHMDTHKAAHDQSMGNLQFVQTTAQAAQQRQDEQQARQEGRADQFAQRQEDREDAEKARKKPGGKDGNSEK